MSDTGIDRLLTAMGLCPLCTWEHDGHDDCAYDTAIFSSAGEPLADWDE